MLDALFFDVFGTLVDWRTSVARESKNMLAPLGYNLDWLAFASAWRSRYQPAMEKVRSGGRGFVKLDVLHRENLQEICSEFRLQDVADHILDELARSAWRKLDAWPDVSEGLKLLREKVLIAPVSNGNISLMAAIARHNALSWDAILGAEIAHDFKPNPAVYDAACAAFDLPPERCAMVAAHTGDLVAAASRGMKTIHVSRPDEHGPGRGEQMPLARVDFAVGNLIELARVLPS